MTTVGMSRRQRHGDGGRPVRACARWRQRAGGGGVLRRVDVEAVATSELEAAAVASCRGAAVTSGGGGSRV